jgi:hypothetical protein
VPEYYNVAAGLGVKFISNSNVKYRYINKYYLYKYGTVQDIVDFTDIGENIVDSRLNIIYFCHIMYYKRYDVYQYILKNSKNHYWDYSCNLTFFLPPKKIVSDILEFYKNNKFDSDSQEESSAHYTEFYINNDFLYTCEKYLHNYLKDVYDEETTYLWFNNDLKVNDRTKDLTRYFFSEKDTNYYFEFDDIGYYNIEHVTDVMITYPLTLYVFSTTYSGDMHLSSSFILIDGKVYVIGAYIDIILENRINFTIHEFYIHKYTKYHWDESPGVPRDKLASMEPDRIIEVNFD